MDKHKRNYNMIRKSGYILATLILTTNINMAQAAELYRTKIMLPDTVTDDWDGDGIPNSIDNDDDHDGILDVNDSNPFDRDGQNAAYEPPLPPYTYGGSKCGSGYSLPVDTVNELNSWSGKSMSATGWCTLHTLDVVGFGVQEHHVTYISENIGALTRLNTLRIATQSVTEIPRSIGELTALKSLTINGTDIDTLPPEISDLISLTTFDVGNNKLTKVPNLSAMSALYKLSISYNSISTFPEEVTSISTLKMVYAYQNQLTSVPDELGTMGLNYLRLVDNPGSPFANIDCSVYYSVHCGN
jgi:hypothetical protein